MGLPILRILSIRLEGSSLWIPSLLSICWTLLARLVLPYIRIWMVIFLYFLCDSGSSHEAFIVWIFLLILIILQVHVLVLASLAIEVLHGLHLRSYVVCWSILLPILKVSWWCWSIVELAFVYNILVVAMLNVLVICCLLSSSLLHGKLLAVLIGGNVWSI